MSPARSAAAADPVDWGDLDVSGMVEVADADPSTPMTFYLGMATDSAGLASFARSVSDPASASYGGYLTVGEVASRFGASTSVQAAVVGYFAGVGLTATVDPTGTYASVAMPLSTAEAVFSADWRLFTPSSGFFSGLDFLYPTTTPTLPGALDGMVTRVHGAVVVDDLGLVPPPVQQLKKADGSTAAVLQAGGGTAYRTGTASGCAEGTGITAGPYGFGMAPNQLLDAYGIDDLQALGLRGEGTRVAIVDDSVYEQAWLGGYRECFGLTDATPVTPHVIGVPSTSESDETILDLSVMSFVAPKVDRFDVFMVDTTADPAMSDTPGQMIAMFGAPLDASQTGGEAPDVVSASFGACEALDMSWAGKTAAVSLLEDVLAAGAAAGVSYLVATGDSGSSGCQHLFGSPPVTDPAVTVESADYPSTSAWVTAVGGTNLTLDDANEIVTSGVWNDEVYQLATPQYLAGTGGTSAMVARPWYQGEGLPSGTTRVVPDVSAFADALPGYAILGPSAAPAPDPDPGTWQAVGGTSAATPLLAGATLLLDQLALQRGQPTMGFLNPLLYALAGSGGTGTASILDITLSDDDLFDVGCCSAASGYDLATGWGSPLVDRVSAALADPGLQVSAPESTVGGTVTFTAAASPAAGAVTSYAWDLGSDGAVDATTTSPTYNVPATVAGTVRVRVTATTNLARSTTVEAVATTTTTTTTTTPATEAPIAFAG